MKKLVIGVCCLSVALMAASYSFGESEDALKKALQGLESKKVDVDSLYHVFTLLDYAPNAVVHTSVLHVCGAGLLYIGQHDRYRAIRPRIAKIEEFEKKILSPCHACQGSGQFSSACTTCKGSGKCSNGVCISCHICKGNQSHYNCRHGKVKRTGFDGKETYENCGLCRGTHKCQKCDGKGSLSEPCGVCEGNGVTFSPSMAFAKYKESVAAALAAFGTTPEPEQLIPGLHVQEYPRHPHQDQGIVYVPEVDLGEPVGASRVIHSLAGWSYTPSRNALAKGYLKIEHSGEYAFNSNNFYDHNALYIGGNLICSFRDGEGRIARTNLVAGMVEIVSWGAADSRGSVAVKWQPPGQRELSSIPTNLFYHVPSTGLTHLVEVQLTPPPAVSPALVAAAKPAIGGRNIQSSRGGNSSGEGAVPGNDSKDRALKICDVLATKRNPEGLTKSAIRFSAPAGNGRSGANGFIIEAPSGWEGHGTEWNFTYSGPGHCFGFQLIHPFKDGHVLVRVLTYPLRGSKITISTNIPWRVGGWRGASDIKVTEITPILELEADLRGSTPVEIISSLSPKGEYKLYIGGKLAVQAEVTSASPLDLSNPDGNRVPHGSSSATTQFAGEALPMLLKKGQAGVIIAPTDRHAGAAREIILTSSNDRRTSE